MSRRLQISAKEAVIAACACGCGTCEVEADKDEVQLFPPGQHRIVAKMDGKPVELDVNIGEEQAATIAKDFDKMVAEAKAGRGPKPFLDFNHEDREASAWVETVFWAGNDPVRGGVRAKVEWSKPGKEAVAGKSYRQFSPNFLIDTRTKQIIGTTPNMGGLVNRPAFRGIQPFFAKDGAEQPSKPTMKKLTALLATAGLISAANAENDDLAAAEFSEKFATLKAASAERDAAKSELATVSAKHAALADAHAERIVTEAVAAGRIAAKDSDTRAMWKTLLVADPKNAALLASIAPVQAADATQKIVTQGGKTPDKGEKSGEQKIVVLAKEIATSEKISYDAALVKAASQNPAAYDEYRVSLVAARN